MKFLLLFLLLPLFSFGQDKLSKNLEEYMQAQADVNKFSGTVLVMKNDAVLLKKAYGFADYEWEIPNTIETKFGLASVTKCFTAIAILQLAEKGKLTLTDKLNKFFPEYPKGDSVTIHMLLTHTAGLDLDFEELYLEHVLISKDSAIAYIESKPYVFSPGTNCRYSNIGYFLLSQIIEKSSGESYAAYLHTNIFEPAGMKNSGISNNDSLVNKRAKAYYPLENGYMHNPYINWNLCIGLDGVYSTAEDLYRLDRALYGETLLSEESKMKMNTPYNKKYPDNGFFENYGYGIFINPYYNHNHFLLTHSGGYFGVMTSFDRFPEDNVFITVLSNNGSASHWVSYGLSGIVFDVPVELPYKHEGVAIDSAVLEKYAGSYGKINILNVGNKLYYNSEATELIPESAIKFFHANDNNRTVEFVTNKKGKIESVILTKGGVKETHPKNTAEKKRK